MNMKDLQKLLEQNNGRIKNIKIKEAFYKDCDFESADNGMICDIIGCNLVDEFENDKTCVIKMDFEPYMDYNKSIAKRNWNGNRIWFETNSYDKNGNDVWLAETQDLNELFEFQEIKSYVFSLNNEIIININAISLGNAKIQFVDKLVELGYVNSNLKN